MSEGKRMWGDRHHLTKPVNTDMQDKREGGESNVALSHRNDSSLKEKERTVAVEETKNGRVRMRRERGTTTGMSTSEGDGRRAGRSCKEEKGQTL